MFLRIFILVLLSKNFRGGPGQTHTGASSDNEEGYQQSVFRSGKHNNEDMWDRGWEGTARLDQG
jgi:hypothetical protein